MLKELRPFILPAVAIIVSLGSSFSDITSSAVAIVLWSLSVLLLIIALCHYFWPYLKRLRIGFKPPDHQLQQLKEERDSLRESYSESQRKLQKLESTEGRRIEQIRELEEERNKLQQSYEEVSAQLGTQLEDNTLKEEATTISQKLIQLAQKRNAKNLQARIDSLALGNATGEEILVASQAKGKYDEETKALFSEKYESDVRALLEAVERKGWCTTEQRKEIEGIFNGNWLSDPVEQIKKGAARIAAFGKRY